MNHNLSRLAFVDLETTGGAATGDRITEVGIIEVDEQGVREWSSLVNPEVHIPEFIQSLTGISNEMVANAPTFSELADEIHSRLAGRVFIAHNARFDHGFLASAFKRTGHDFRPPVLCTVRLSRKLFPDFERHNLDALAERHDLRVTERHRALGDAQLIWQFWQRIHESHAPEAINAVVSKLIGRPAGRPAPSATPLNTATPAEAASLIDQFAGAGRAEALTYAWRLISRNGTLQPVLATADDLFFAHDPQLYGLFASEQAAKDMLDSIVDEHSLCRIVLGLEKSRGRKQCSARRLHKCRGACAGSEPVDAHNVRLATALQHVQVQPWPYKNAIGISEGDSIHVIDDWAYLGTAIGVDKASALLQKGSRRFDPEVYRIMQRWLLKPTGSIIAL